jgi:hypothetical protein
VNGGTCARIFLVAWLAGLISACGAYPSQTNPTCSWTSQPPGNADAICKETFMTLTMVVKAEERGDSRAVRDLVTNPLVAARIIDFGSTQRAKGLRELHVVPSLTLGSLPGPNQTGVGFQLGGHGKNGNFEGSETVYVRIKAGRAVIVADQPNQEW